MKRFMGILLACLLCLSTAALAMNAQPPAGGKQSAAQEKPENGQEQSQADFQEKSDLAAWKEVENRLEEASMTADVINRAIEQAEDPAATMDSLFRMIMLCQAVQNDLISDGRLRYDLLEETAAYYGLEYQGDPYEGDRDPEQRSPWNFEWALPGGVYAEFLVKNMENEAKVNELIVWEINLAIQTAGKERISMEAYWFDGVEESSRQKPYYTFTISE